MKHNLILLLALWVSLISQAQNVGIGTTSPAAKLDISSANSGILIPRMALTSNAVAAPVTAPTTSMMIYNTATAGSGATAVTPGYYYWTGTAWRRMLDNGTTTATTNSMSWTQTSGLNDTVNGIRSNVTPAFGTINTVLGYDTAGQPVYSPVLNTLFGGTPVPDFSCMSIVDSVGIGSYVSGAQPTAVVVSGNYAYATFFTGHICSIDISNPSAPVLLTVLSIGSQPKALVVSGNLLM